MKPQLYAQAGVPVYLRVEFVDDEPVGHLHGLVDGTYREIARDPTVTLAEPFPVTLDLGALAC